MKKLLTTALALAILAVPSTALAAPKHIHKGKSTNTNTCSIVINGVKYDCNVPVHYVSDDGNTKINITVTSVQF